MTRTQTTTSILRGGLEETLTKPEPNPIQPESEKEGSQEPPQDFAGDQTWFF